MNALGHAFIGFLLALAFTSLINTGFWTKMGVGAVVLFFSLFPDIDHEKAIMRKLYRRVVFVVFFVTMVTLTASHTSLPWALAISLLLSYILLKLTEFLIPRHRGIIHSIWFAILVSFIVYVLAKLFLNSAELYGTGAFVGYVGHLVADRL